MVFLIQVIYRLVTIQRIRQVKPFSLHLSLLLLIFIYAMAGGLIFNRLEAEATREQQQRDWQTKTDCVLRMLDHVSEPLVQQQPPAGPPLNNTAQQVMLCFRTEQDHRSQWGLVTGTLYGFGIVTTLGYNRIAPITLAGRLFCVFYGICGIPMTMIIIANIGQYLNKFAGATRKNIETYRERRRRSRVSITGEDIPGSSIEVMSVGLLVAFLVYVCLGAVLLPLLNGELDFYNGIYFNFLCLTAIDFGQLVPNRWAYLPITFLYVCIGLAITTIAIDIGSEYMKKLHHFGKKMKNVAQTRIWFGGKTLRVRDLLHAVGKKCGVDPSEIDKLDLENVVERAVALNEGRELPADTNEEPLPPKEPRPPSPAAAEEKPLLEQQPKRMRTPPVQRAAERYLGGPQLERAASWGREKAERDLRLDLCEFVAIDMELPDDQCAAEQALTWMEPPKLVMRPQHELVRPDPALASPTDLTAWGPPRVIVDEQQRVLDEPRKFKEKKEKYGRDAKKLYETYQEEWERLERLSDRRLGPRRKSVLALNAMGAGRTREQSPEGVSISPNASPLLPSSSHAQQLQQPSSALSSESEPSGDGSQVGGRRPSRPKPVFSPPPWRTQPQQQQQQKGTTDSDNEGSRASASPQALRPPTLVVQGTDPRRASLSPRSVKKLSFSKYQKFGSLVPQPHVPANSTPRAERRHTTVMSGGMERMEKTEMSKAGSQSPSR